MTSSTQSLTEESSRPKPHRTASPGGWRRVGPRWIGGVGPPRPARSAKRCDSGEWVTEPIRRGPTRRQAPPASSTGAHEPREQSRRRKSVKLLPSRLGNDELRRSAIRRPDDFEVAADPLAHGAGELDLRALEAHRTENRRVLVGSDVLANRLAVHADLLDRRLENLQARPAVGAGPAVRLLLEALHVGVEVRLRGGAGLHAPRADAADPIGVGAQ